MILAEISKGILREYQKILVVGTCRSRDMVIGERNSEFSSQFVSKCSTISGFAHSLQDSIQQIEILKFGKKWPLVNDLLIHGNEKIRNYDERRADYSSMGDSFQFTDRDLVLVEWSSMKRYTVNGWDVNPSYLGHHIIRPGGLIWLDWWTNGALPVDILDDFLENRGDISEAFTDDDLVHILNNTRIVNVQSDEILQECVERLVELSDKSKLAIFVPHYRPNRISDYIAREFGSFEEGFILDVEGVFRKMGKEDLFRREGRDLSHFEPDSLNHIQATFFEALREKLVI